jgi:hypothetical protein
VKLAGMFAKVADPFPASDKKSNPSLSLGTIRRMRELKAQGYTVAKIAEDCGTCRSADRPPARRQPPGALVAPGETSSSAGPRSG